jgi:hypothetical protein
MSRLENWENCQGPGTKTMRTTKQQVFLAACVASATLMLGTSANANLVQNGDFGTGTLADWTQVGNTGFAGVTSGTLGSISPLPGYTYYAYFGAIGSEGGIIQTTLATTAGASYTFSFWLSNNNGSPANDTISWNNGTVLSQNNPGPFGWTHYSYDVTATSSSTAVEFEFEQVPSVFGLTGIDVESVPEPSTYIAGALMLLPLGASGLKKLRKHSLA